MTQEIVKRHREMFDMLPRFYNDAPEADGLLYANAVEIERIRHDARDLLTQLTATTASWGLSDWERVLELPPRPNSPPEVRRSRILTKLRGTAPATIANMLAIVNAHTKDNDSRINELPIPGVVEFVLNANNAFDYTSLSRDISVYMPAHLDYRFATETNNRLNYGVCPQSGILLSVYPYRPEQKPRHTKITHASITHNAQIVSIYPKGDE